uniref:Uncharacterized protein n=1 Tax=Brassica oleracea TaxID=3712 RepID=A0A3P6FET1_BRAOL|nr:unnamed protein product [Brassica oleracea]
MSEANKFSISVIESFALFLRFLLVRILSVLLDKMNSPGGRELNRIFSGKELRPAFPGWM